MEEKEDNPGTSNTLNELLSQCGSQIEDKHCEENQNGKEMLRTSSHEILHRQEPQEDLILQFQTLSISNNEDKQDDTSVYSFQPSPVEINSNLMYEFLHNDANYTCLDGNNIYNLIPLNEHSVEFFKIKNLFTSNIKNCFNIKSIEKIYNPYLLGQFKLMEKCYRERYGYTSIKQLLHGTKRQNIDNICKYNFNWRLQGTSRGTRYGQGVYFTPIANYATYFGDKTFEKVMIVADVLVTNKFVGVAGTVIPPSDYDTTIKENEHVFVKYEDNTFYPAYVIHYQGINKFKSRPRTILFI